MNVTAEASARWAGASVRASEAEVQQGGGAQEQAKGFWRVGFLMVSVMRRMKEPRVGSRLPLLACWVADFPTFQFSDLSAC